YKTQLGKNALYEVSRFCFENLRKENPASPTDNFAEHWGDYKSGDIEIGKVNDSGNPKFGKTLQDPSDKDKVFQDIFKSINGTSGQGLSEKAMSAFFMECGKIIVPLCGEFEKKISLDATTSQVDVTKPTVGAAACLAKNRIQEYKKALVNAEKISDEFTKMKFDDQKDALI